MDEKTITVPKDVEIAIVSKSFRDFNFESGFTPFRATVGLGKTEIDSQGVIMTEFCFVTLHYDEVLSLVTSDFDAELV